MYDKLVKHIEQFIIEHNQPTKFTLIIDDNRINGNNFKSLIDVSRKSKVVSKYNLKWNSENSFGNGSILLYGVYKKW